MALGPSDAMISFHLSVMVVTASSQLMRSNVQPGPFWPVRFIG